MTDSSDLTRLPENPDTVQTEEEKGLMAYYFGDKEYSDGKSGKSCPSVFLVILYISFLYVIFGNPFIDPILAKFPYMNNPLIRFGAKLAFFAIAVGIVYSYAV